MKKNLLGVLMAIFILSCVSEADAWFWQKKEKPPAAAPKKEATEEKKAPEVKKEPAKPQVNEAELKKKRELSSRKRKELDRTEWEIQLVPLSPKAKKEQETIIFKNNKIEFLLKSKKGFNPTNYTLTVQSDGTVVWETMQSSEKTGTFFWRGEMDPNLTRMSGVASYQLDEKTKEDYTFNSVSKKDIPEEEK